MKRYFITGTDTDCGKSYVTSKLVAHIPNSFAIKPIASGGPGDALLLQASNPYPLSLDGINPWCFKRAVSPHIAAAKEGQSLSIASLCEYCLNGHWPGITRLFIEGAGGLMVPINATATWLDFLKQSEIPAIMVVGMKLGCINHALLTETAFRFHSLHCVGWIANGLGQEMDCFDENLDTLIKKLSLPLLGLIKTGKEKIESDEFSFFRAE